MTHQTYGEQAEGLQTVDEQTEGLQTVDEQTEGLLVVDLRVNCSAKTSSLCIFCCSDNLLKFLKKVKTSFT